VIIDAHCHVWPDAIAEKVLANRPADLDARYDGTVAGLLATMDTAGIDKAMTLGIAHAARTVARTNEFIGSLDRSRFIPFGTVHPDLPIDDNLRYLRDNGVRGVKLHPLFQSLSLVDPAVLDILRALAEAGIVVITHVGAGGSPEENERATPRDLRNVVDIIPDIVLIACHYGGYHRMAEAEEYVVGSDVILETSWPPRLSDVDAGQLRAIIARHGTDRVVFGSDWPMTDPAQEIAAIRALELDPLDEAALLGGNLARVLGMEAA
jgi:predicted TIM-barrel fold metal-dependent hydrolase